MSLKKLTNQELIEKLSETETKVSEMINFSVRLKYEIQTRLHAGMVENGIKSGPFICQQQR